MNDIPPPSSDPVPGVPTPRPATRPTSRPPALTGDTPFLDGDEAGRVIAVILIVQGGLSLLAGWWVFRLRPAGRILGIVLTVVGIISALAQLRRSGSSGFLTLALDAFVLYAGKLDRSSRAWKPTPSDAFTAVVVMVPTMSEYFGQWKVSRFVLGDRAQGDAFNVVSRLSDIGDILGGLRVIYAEG